MSDKIVLLDGHSILNRAFYGVPDLSNAEGLHTNAVYGFLNILFKILDEEQPQYLAVAFDLHVPTFRHKMYDQYQATPRPPLRSRRSAGASTPSPSASTCRARTSSSPRRCAPWCGTPPSAAPCTPPATCSSTSPSGARAPGSASSSCRSWRAFTSGRRLGTTQKKGPGAPRWRSRPLLGRSAAR